MIFELCSQKLKVSCPGSLHFTVSKPKKPPLFEPDSSLRTLPDDVMDVMKTF